MSDPKDFKSKIAATQLDWLNCDNSSSDWLIGQSFFSSPLKKDLQQSIYLPYYSQSALSNLLTAGTEYRGFLQNLIDKDPDLIFIKDREQRFVMANSSVADVYGAAPHELLNRSDADFNSNLSEVDHFSSDDREVIITATEKFISCETVSAADGTKRLMRTIKVPIINSEGQATHVLGIASDISKHRELELLKKFLASSTKAPDSKESDCEIHQESVRFSAASRGVLIVDDDEAVRDVTGEILINAGCTVYIASDGLSGLDCFLENIKNIRLVLLDIAMPRIDGEELFRQLKRVAPSIPVVVCSGLQEASVRRTICPDDFLEKPYAPKHLLHVVKRYLNQ